MARSHISDFLSVGRFHLIDISFSIPPVLLPVYGFRSCTLPQLNLDVHKIKEGNYEYPRKIIRGADVGTVTLEQGVQLINSDFWDWVRKAVIGRVEPKNLMLIQFTRMSEIGNRTTGNRSNTLSIPGAGGGGNLFSQAAFGNIEFAKRLPGRAWIFYKCRPASYRPGTDFDAMAQDVSIASLEVDMEEFTEISLGV